jgi:hypothetical protein
LQVAGLPVQGRSGGGLFSTSGQLIGVCNAADPADQEGLFAAASTIHAQLDQAGLASVYQRGPEAATGNAAMADLRAAAGGIANAATKSAAIASASAALQQLSPNERAALSELRQKSQGAEVICIVRSLSDPKAKSEIIVLDKASAAFLNLLADERQIQDGRQLTSLEVPRPAAPAESKLPNQKSGGRGARPANVPPGAAGTQNWQPNWRPNP